ncbi:futalosine hydrolase [Actinacidiphila yanglinensis]|uniref:Futalosine hydrolase n=1 Tax=Actinacidiphila yanglinensis TaxID=310779 RepID=A0A1H5Z5Q1_9ACTN|nr:futalosine hydrolase [Actinacidiphila yanglinensis]SEG31859.1 futalosine hydrolase [Actinacidiphila yanglinensis]
MSGTTSPVRRLLVVTAVAAEREAAAAGLASALVPGAVTTDSLADGAPATPFEAAATATGPTPAPHPLALHATVLAGGVGPGAAAATTAAALARAEAAGRPYDLVVSAGIGGGFAPAVPVGSVAVASAIVAADLGAQTPDGFVPVAELGFGTSRHLPPQPLGRTVAEVLAAAYGPVLTVSTVTGSAERAAELADRHPGAVAEAMEGFGVAEAAGAAGLPVLEIRTVSNAVGPRDRAAWRIGEALEALTAAFGKLPGAMGVGTEHG